MLSSPYAAGCGGGVGDSMRLIGGMIAPALRVARGWQSSAYWLFRRGLSFPRSIAL
jgi:hypothetical protein